MVPGSPVPRADVRSLTARCIGAWLLGVACSGPQAAPPVAGAVVAPAAAPVVPAMRMPTMQVATVTPLGAGMTGITIRVHLAFEGTLAPDTTVQALRLDRECGTNFVDTQVERNGTSVVGALVWVEAPAAVIDALPVSEHRPTVTLENCRLEPRVQVVALGSTLQLVAHDTRVESLVVVPVPRSARPDTVQFNTDGQLVPLQHRADSVGVIAIHASRLPWARAFVIAAPSGTSGISDAGGRVTFVFDVRETRATIRVWHPRLGEASTAVNPSTFRADSVLTITFRR